MRGDPWLVTLRASRTFNMFIFTEAVPSSCLGSALALRALLGFGAGAIGPLATTWGWAFATLGLGGLAAAYCAWGLGKER